MTATLHLDGTALVREVEHRSGTPLGACYQCHKCSSGCPVGPETDLLPSQVIRLVQFGREKEVLRSRAIWLCASCEACTARCPMGIDVAAVMDALRMMAIDRKAAVEPRGAKFNQSFLDSVRRWGRVYELGMLLGYKIRSGDLLADVGKFPRMVAKGKIAFLPKICRGAGRVQRVFKRAEEEEGKP